MGGGGGLTAAGFMPLWVRGDESGGWGGGGHALGGGVEKVGRVAWAMGVRVNQGGVCVCGGGGGTGRSSCFEQN